jgi:asparagine synthase (glutamine-hydrolysing)
MCGFLGEITTQLIDPNSFQKLLDLSINRGPDQQGFWSDTVCQLGFNRLAILDLSENGKQPLISPSGKYAMVFNGEVYNFKELQLQYKINDKDLRSGSDSEILVHLIEQLPITDFAKALNGMFAISIWDIEKRKLFLIRDFAGIKPLYYGIHKNGLVFASQFDQIFCHPAFENKKLRPEIMKEYFGLGYMQAPNTVFENIFQVEPGQIIIFDYETNKIIEKHNYFNWQTTPIHDETNNENVEKLKTIFSKVIKSQLNSDVPVASFLSGGIDSPLVTAFSKEFKPDIKAFTFGIDDPALNESEIAQKIANQIEVDQHIENCTEKSILSIIDKHFNGLCEPHGDYSSLPTFLITQKAKQFATVMLSGDGGDEVFWGYPRFLRSIENLHWFKLPLFTRKIFIPFYRKLFKKTSSAIDIFPNFENWILNKQIHFSLLDSFVPNTSFSKELLSVYKFDGKHSKQNALLYLKKNEFYAHLQKILRKVDLMSMANSLEVRVPFLDKEIIEFSNTIKPEYGIKHQKSKLILRSLLRLYVPAEITDLPKKGFSVPIEKWLKNELKNDYLKTVLEQPFFGNQFIDRNCLEKLTEDFFEKNKGNAWGLWHIYAWQKWAQKYNLK